MCRLPKHLIHPVRQEDHLARAGIVIHAVVVAVHQIAVPVPSQDLQRAVGGEAVHVQHLVQRGETVRGIIYLRGLRQGLQVRPIAHVALAVLVALQRLCDLAEEAAVVKVSVGILEVHGEEVFGEPLLHHVEAALASIQFERRVGHARGGNAGLAIQFAADVFAEIAAVLHRVVQVNFLQPVKALVGDVLVKAQRQSRLVVDVAPTARRAFHMQAHVAPDVRAFPDGGAHILAVVAPETHHFVRGDLDAQGEDGFVVENFCARHALRCVAGGKDGGGE